MLVFRLSSSIAENGRMVNGIHASSALVQVAFLEAKKARNGMK